MKALTTETTVASRGTLQMLLCSRSICRNIRDNRSNNDSYLEEADMSS
jgi:hypothetical protein